MAQCKIERGVRAHTFPCRGDDEDSQRFAKCTERSLHLSRCMPRVRQAGVLSCFVVSTQNETLSASVRTQQQEDIFFLRLSDTVYQ